MASDNLNPIHPQRLIFQNEEPIHFSRTGGEYTAPPKPSSTSALSSGGDRNPFLRSPYGPQENPRWNFDRGSRSDDDGSYGDDDEDDFDDVDDNNLKNGNNTNNSSSSVHSSSSDKVNGVSNLNLSQQQNDGVGNYENAITIAQPHPESFHGQIMNAGGCTATGSVRKENENGLGNKESLRKHLMDPITGVLMEDAMILPCGHSFGRDGMQHVIRMKACCKCARPISEIMVRPNLALRAAVQAYRREEESQTLKASKRKRDRFELEKCSNDDLYPMDSRGKGVQFPFVVSDRVIIKGNKRTPPRFVGRVAIVTTQCLNGWYVVKTLDNAESVKLQYRSLAKFTDDPSPSIANQNKPFTPNWL